MRKREREILDLPQQVLEQKDLRAAAEGSDTTLFIFIIFSFSTDSGNPKSVW